LIIVIEGVDSSGKSTQTELLKQYLNNKGFKVELFHFPNKHSFLGQEIYNYLNNKDGCDYSRETVELLHTADKMNIQEYISFFKNNNQKYLILDRYNLSQYVYALANNLDSDWVSNLMSKYIDSDIKLFLDIKPEETIKRKTDLDRYEGDLEFLNKVYNLYMESCNKFEYYKIDATGSVEYTHELIKIWIDTLLTV
jgi:dTMP kinase